MMRINGTLKILLVTLIVSSVGIIAFYSQQQNLLKNTNVEINEPKKIIILSYARSGSSLLGEILSSVFDCSYFYEPLGYVCLVLKKCDNYNSYLQMLFNCDDQMLKEYMESVFWIVRKVHQITELEKLLESKNQLSSHCKSDSIRVIKTIRLRMLNVIQLIRHKNNQNLMVVHLIRDPRARYSSLIDGKWSEEFLSVDTMCDEMESDLLLAKYLPDDVYTRIRYEDVIRNPSKTINAIFNKIYGRDYGNETDEYLRTHMAGNGNSTANYDRNNLTIYYNTFRTMGVDLNQWKNNLPEEKIKEIEEKCNYVLNEMKYFF